MNYARLWGVRCDSSPSKYAMGGSIPPAAGTPSAQRLFGYGAGNVLEQVGDGTCFFGSSRASAVALGSLLTNVQSKFFGRTISGLKNHMKEFLLTADKKSPSLLDHKFDMRVGCPPEAPDDDDTAKMASIRQVLQDDHGETAEEHAASMMAQSYYGGVAEMMVIATATDLVVQSGNVSKVGGSSVFQPLLQVSPPTVDLACYPEAMILRLSFNGVDHFDGWQATSRAERGEDPDILRRFLKASTSDLER